MRTIVATLALTAILGSSALAQQPQLSPAEQSLSAAMSQIQASIVLYANEKSAEITKLKTQVQEHDAAWHKWLVGYCGDKMKLCQVGKRP